MHLNRVLMHRSLLWHTQPCLCPRHHHTHRQPLKRWHMLALFIAQTVPATSLVLSSLRYPKFYQLVPRDDQEYIELIFFLVPSLCWTFSSFTLPHSLSLFLSLCSLSCWECVYLSLSHALFFSVSSLHSIHFLSSLMTTLSNYFALVCQLFAALTSLAFSFGRSVLYAGRYIQLDRRRTTRPRPTACTETPNYCHTEENTQVHTYTCKLLPRLLRFTSQECPGHVFLHVNAFEVYVCMCHSVQWCRNFSSNRSGWHGAIGRRTCSTQKIRVKITHAGRCTCHVYKHHHFFFFNTSNDIRKVSPIAQSKLYLYLLATISISN